MWYVVEKSEGPAKFGPVAGDGFSSSNILSVIFLAQIHFLIALSEGNASESAPNVPDTGSLIKSQVH